MNIQEIRKKYPQYNDLSDQELAAGLHKKFYSDLPFGEFARRIGLQAEVPAAPTAPALTPAQRVAAVETPTPVSPEEITATQPSSVVPADEGLFARNYRYAKDALLSGFESFRSNVKGEAFAISRGAMLRDEEEYGGPGVPLAPPDVKKRYERNKAEAGEYAQDIAKFQKEAKERQIRSPLRPETARLKAAMGDDVAFLESAKEAGAALISNPVGVIADLGAESFPAMAYMVSTALLGRLGLQSPTAGAVGGGVGSAISQFGNEYVDRLQKGESHDEAWKNAAIRSGVIGTFDAISLKTAGTAAGKIVEALKTNKPVTVAAKEFTKEMGKQAGLGGAGEAAGSLAIGEVPNPAAVIAEAAGELVTGPFEAVGTYKRVKQTEEERLIAGLDALSASEAAAESRAAAPEVRTAFATGFKQMYGRDATDEELDQMVETYEQRKMAAGVVGPNVTGRIEPSFQAPGEAVTEEGVAATPTEPGAAGVAVPGVPTDVAGVGAAPQPSPLSSTFSITPTSSAQEKASVRHYQDLQRQPNNPVTQSLTALDTSIQKAKDAYADIAAQLNIPSSEDMIGLGVQLPAPIGALFNYPSAAGSAARLVNASKDVASGAKRGSQAKVDSALKQVQGEIVSVDKVIADALAAAEDPAVQEQVNKLNEQLAVNKGVAARQSEVANLPLKERVAALKKIEDEVRAGLKTETVPVEVPTGFAYRVTDTPAYEGTEPLSADDAVVELEFLLEQAKRNRLTPENFSQSEIGKRLDTGQITAINKSLRADPVQTVQSLINSLQTPETAAPAQPPAAAPIGLPEGMNDAQFLDAATKLQAGKVGAVKFQTLKALRDSGLALSNNSLSPEGEALLDQLATTAKPADLRPSGETIKAKPGANVRRLSKLLGPKLYGEPKEMPKVSVKEMVQNSFDAIKPMQERGELVQGTISVSVDSGARIISVLDNGTGMSPETLSTTFLTIAGTKKEGTRDSGGLGIAKMQFLFNNERIKVVTYRDGKLSVLESTGVELEEAMDNPNLAPNVQVYSGADIPTQYLEMFPDGHGTFAEVVVPESYKDSSTGEDIAIDIPNYVSSYAVLEKSPLFSDISVTFNGNSVDIGNKFPYDKYTQFADVKFDWGTARIYVQKIPQRFMYGDNLRILSNGLWQFDGRVSIGAGFNAKPVPRYFYLDVSPNKNVKPEDPNYPFDLNRQRFSPTTEKGFQQLINYLNLIYGAVDLGNEAKNFGSIQYLYDDKGVIKATASEELAPKGDAGVVKVASAISEGDVIEVKEGKLIVKGRVIPELSQDDLKNSRINLDEFKINQLDVDANRVMLHDNVELPDQNKIKALDKELSDAKDAWYKDDITDSEWEAKKAEISQKLANVSGTSLVQMARDKFGQRFDKFIYEIGVEFQILRSYVADIMDYKDLRNEAIGISFDTEYRGVSIRLPFNGSYINPAVTEAEKMGDAAAGLVGTMIHELAHHKVRSHNADFSAEMQRIMYRMEGQELEFGDTTISDIKRRVFKILRGNKNIFEFIRKVNTDANAKPRGKRFQDSGSFERRDERRADLVEGLGGEARGEPGIPGGIESSPGNLEEERERARFSGQVAPGSLEDQIINKSLKAGSISQPVAQAIARGDLSGALRLLSSRLTNPLYKELAEVLANLNLPTTIIFNGGRDLTRRQIDLKSAKQQTRLFSYIELTYPDVYDKYFKNYDREENLEKVYDGIKHIRAGRYNLQPVIAEFTDVNKAFEDNIRGLEVAGAYYPAFDAITIDFDNATNDTFLHEVLHAATEAILNAPLETLTEGQRAARKELQKMYEYAVASIPLDLYGLTDIHEFVSEVYTNKSFRDRLEKIEYKPAKVPLLTRLVRAIYQMVGIDNLAGNAMATATQLFSAVRTRTAISAGARFAPKGKRVRGPISTTWRTAEQTGVKLTKEVEDAIKGHTRWSDMLPMITGAMWDAGNTVFRKAILGVANLRQIDDLTKTKFPQISGAIRIIEQMIADRNRTMTKAKDILTVWTRAQARNPGQSRLMGRIMLESTIRGIDPDTAQAGSLNPAMQAAWNGLKPEFRDIYRRVRDFYADSINTMILEMKKRALQLPKAERQKVIKEINAKFGPDKLVKPYFPLRRFGQYWFQVGSGNFKEFYEFETAIGRELAFRKRQKELSRGNAKQKSLADTIRKGNGISELYNQNASSTQVLKDAQELVDNVTANNVADIKKELKESLDQLIYILLPQQSVRKMFINRQSIQGASEDMIRVFATTAVHTAYQQSRFKFAEKFVNNLMNAKDYIKDLPNSDVYDDYIKEVEKRTPTILSNEDTSMGAVVAGKLSDATFYFMLSAPFSAMLNILGMAAITMPYIGGRYGYAKANAVMLKNLGRYTATMPKRTISPALKGQIMQMEFPSIVEGGNLDPLMQRAADRFIEDNDINISQTNDIMDIGGRPSELYTGRYNTVKRAIAALFHQSERLNREVTLLSVFELAYDKFLNEPKKDLRGVIQRDNAGNPISNTPDEAFELAITEAKDIAGLSLGDFTRQMKPRYFTPPLLSVLTKFKQYSVLATYVVARNFYFTFAAPFRKAEIEEFRQQMIKDKIPQNIIDQRIAEADAQRRETYKEGRRRLAGILGMTFLLGGAEALPFFTLGIGTLVKMLGNDDDDEFFDWDNWFKNYMEVELGGYVADLYKKMGMEEKTAKKAGRATMEAAVRGPASVITGGSLTERVSLDPVNLWLRDPRFSTDTRESVVEGAIANAGPVVGLMVNWAEAVELMEQGQYQRAFEKAAPAIVAKPVSAYRLADEGAKTKSGIKLVDNFSAWEIAMQSIGLQPERLAQKQKAAIEAKTYEQKVLDRRETLMNRLWLERGNVDGYEDTIEKVQKFNQKYPEYRIEPKTVVDSFKRRAKSQTEAEVFGAQIQKKLRPRVSPMLEYGRDED